MPGITIDDLPLYDDSNVDSQEIVLEIEQKTIIPETERSRKISLSDLMKEGTEDITGDGLLSNDGVIKVDNTIVRTSREIIAGDGLSGGGDLTENRTLSINVGVTAGDGLSGGGTLTQTRTIDVDNTVVRTSGDQTIDGIKTFSTQIRIPTSTPPNLANGAIWVA